MTADVHLSLDVVTMCEALAGTPLVMDVLTQATHRSTRLVVAVGETTEMPIAPGVYSLRLLLPSGRALVDSVEVPAGLTSSRAEIALDHIAPEPWLLRHAVFEPTPELMPAPGGEPWFRLWRRDGDAWSAAPEHCRVSDRAGDALRLTLAWLPDLPHVLQFAASGLPSTLVTLPRGADVEVVVRRPSATRAEASALASDNAAESLLGYLRIGANDAARAVAIWIHERTGGEASGRALRTALGQLGLREVDAEIAFNLTEPNDVDAAVTEALRQIRFPRADDHFDGARDLLVAAASGLPTVYVESMRLLSSGLRLLRDTSDGATRQDLDDALGRVRRYLRAGAEGGATFVFTGTGPDQPRFQSRAKVSYTPDGPEPVGELRSAAGQPQEPEAPGAAATPGMTSTDAEPDQRISPTDIGSSPRVVGPTNAIGLSGDIFLLSHDADGRPRINESILETGVVGAVLCELVHLDLVEVLEGCPTPISSTQGNDAVSALALQRLTELPGQQVQTWVQAVRKELFHHVAQRLADSGAIVPIAKALPMFRTSVRYRAASEAAAAMPAVRVVRLLVSSLDEPDEPTYILAHLVYLMQLQDALPMKLRSRQIRGLLEQVVNASSPRQDIRAVLNGISAAIAAVVMSPHG